MFSFKKIGGYLSPYTKPPVDPLIIKLGNIDVGVASRLLTRNIGTERIVIVGTSLFAFNEILLALIKTHENGGISFKTNAQSKTIREFLTEGDQLDISGLLLERFRVLSTKFITEVFKNQESDTNTYYYEIINNIYERLCELNAVDLKQN